MNFTEMDYMKGTTSLLKEVLKLKKYKAMSLVWAILTAVLMSPWIIASVLFAAISYVLGFVSKSMIAPIDYLHVLLNKEGGEVKHATQFIIYFISWPLIFFLYALVSVTLFFLSVVYAFLACFCYIASLGGFRFHLFLSEAQDLNTQANGKYRNWIPLVFVVCSCTLLLLIPLLQTMWYYFVDLPLIQNQPLSDYKFSYILTSMASTFQYYFVRKIGFFTFFSALYSLIVFVPFPKNNTNN